eukprot:COSAG01_NODE_39108_length_481_cov_0.638743_1_plen_28_part_10
MPPLDTGIKVFPAFKMVGAPRLRSAPPG